MMSKWHLRLPALLVAGLLSVGSPVELMPAVGAASSYSTPGSPSRTPTQRPIRPEASAIVTDDMDVLEELMRFGRIGRVRYIRKPRAQEYLSPRQLSLDFRRTGYWSRRFNAICRR